MTVPEVLKAPTDSVGTVYDEKDRNESLRLDKDSHRTSLPSEFSDPAYGHGLNIIDIRPETERTPRSLEEDIIAGLQQPTGSKYLPSLLMWDEVGQQLYGDILATNCYYPFQAEKDILLQHANEIAQTISSAGVEIIVELGAGNMSKTTLLLEALDQMGHKFLYCALDVDRTSLEESIQGINSRSTLRNIQVKGLLGTYENGASWLSQHPWIRERRKAYVWLGSSVANVPRANAGNLMRSFVPSSQISSVAGMLLGVDGCCDQRLIERAYDTPRGESRRWVRHTLKAAQDCIGVSAQTFFDDDNWRVDLHWDSQAQQFDNYLRATKPLQVTIDGRDISINQDEKVHIIGSAKWQPEQFKDLAHLQELRVAGQWTDTKTDYHMYWLQPRK